MGLLELNRDIINGRAGGRTIWQPRIECWFDDREYRREPLPGRYAGCSRRELYEKLGCSDRLYVFNSCFSRHYDETIKRTSERLDPFTTKTTLETPAGSVFNISRGNTSNPGQMPVKWFVENEDDLKVFTYIEEHTYYTYSQERYDELYAGYSHLGLPAVFSPRTGLQNMLIELGGVENTYYLLADSPELVECYFEASSKSSERYFELVRNSPFEWVNFGENLHCKITPPEYFKKYVLPEFEKRRSLLPGKFLYAHFDGDFYDYIPYMKSGCFLNGYEALTPKPQGDVTLEQMLEACGKSSFLVDGIAATLFSDTYPAECLIEQTKRVLNMFEGRLILGISDELCSDGSLERVGLVRDIVEEFNAKH